MDQGKNAFSNQNSSNDQQQQPSSDTSPLVGSHPQENIAASSTIDSTSKIMNSPTKNNDNNTLDDDLETLSYQYGGDEEYPNLPASPRGSFQDELPSSTSWNSELFQLVGLAATTAATLGYDVGSMAGAIGPMDAEFEMTSWEKELAMGSLNFIAAGGALLGGPWADKHGRKSTIGATCKLFLVGSILMAAAPNYWTLLAGRIIAGLGVGVAFVVAPCFISEVAPPDQRGQLNTTFDIAINAGILLGYIVCYIVQITLPDAGYSWRIMLGLGALLPATVLALLAGLPESPRWLVLAKQQVAAKAVLQRLGSSMDEAEESVRSMEQEIKTFQQIEAAEQAKRAGNRQWGISEGKRLAFGLGFWQQISGTEAVLYYSADFLTRAGLESPALRLLGNVAVGCSKLIPELIAMRIVDTVGRRPLLILSSILLACTITLMGVAFTFQWSAGTVVILLCAIMGSFSTGVGPFTFLCASENLAMSERASGVTMAAAVNRCTSGIIALTAVSLSEWLGDAGLFFMYGVAAFGALMFYAFVVPETSGASLEELTAARAQRHNLGESSGGGETASSVEMEFRHLNPIT